MANNFFSGDNLKILEKFIEAVDKMQKGLDKVAVSQDTINKKTRQQAELTDYINTQLEHGGENNVELYQRAGELLREVNEEAKKGYKNAEERAIMEDKINRKLWERRDILNSIDKQNKAQQRLDKITDAKKDLTYSVLGTNAQNVQDIKDGTYGLKLAANTFRKAVDIFKRAVEAGIDKNYNTTEASLNRIVASNSNQGTFGWNRGSFSFGGRSYTGYKQINNAVVDRLNDYGLYDNIGNTQVIEAASKLTAEGGFGLEEAVTKAFNDTVINYVVPYLDTSSEVFNSLEYLMPRNF